MQAIPQWPALYTKPIRWKGSFLHKLRKNTQDTKYVKHKDVILSPCIISRYPFFDTSLF